MKTIFLKMSVLASSSGTIFICILQFHVVPQKNQPYPIQELPGLYVQFHREYYWHLRPQRKRQNKFA